MVFNFRSITPQVVAAADKKPGHSDFVLLAVHSSFTSWGTILNDGTPGSTKMVTGDHGFAVNDGFFGMQCKAKSIHPTADAAGEAGGQVRNFKYEVTIKGDSAIIDEFIDQILNEDLVALFNDPICGQQNLVQVGGECTPANISGYTFEGGTKGAGGSKEHKFVIESPDRFWYSGEVVRKVEGAQLPTATGLTADDITNDGLTVEWNAVSGATSYDVQVSSTPLFTTGGATQAFSGITDLEKVVTGLEENTIYYIRVRGVAAGKVPGEWVMVAKSTVLLAAPATLGFAAVATTTLTVNWALVAGASNYTIQRSSSAYFGIIDTTATLSPLTQNVTGLTAGATYYFRVRANGTDGSSAWVTASVTMDV